MLASLLGIHIPPLLFLFLFYPTANITYCLLFVPSEAHTHIHIHIQSCSGSQNWFRFNVFTSRPGEGTKYSQALPGQIRTSLDTTTVCLVFFNFVLFRDAAITLPRPHLPSSAWLSLRDAGKLEDISLLVFPGTPDNCRRCRRRCVAVLIQSVQKLVFPALEKVACRLYQTHRTFCHCRSSAILADGGGNCPVISPLLTTYCLLFDKYCPFPSLGQYLPLQILSTSLVLHFPIIFHRRKRK